MKHKHHIIPRYEGGSNHSTNLVELTLCQHVMWHFAEWTRKGNQQDYVAYKMLSGQVGDEERMEVFASMGGSISKERGLGIHSLTVEQRRETSLRTWEQHKKNNTGRASSEYQREMAKKRKGSPNAKNSCKKVNSEKWRCTVTGYITTAGPLTSYQRSKGIDPSNREKISGDL